MAILLNLVKYNDNWKCIRMTMYYSENCLSFLGVRFCPKSGINISHCTAVICLNTWPLTGLEIHFFWWALPLILVDCVSQGCHVQVLLSEVLTLASHILDW